MATPMELSLDDIISQTKKTGRGGGRGRGRGRGGLTRTRGFAGARTTRTAVGQRGRGSFRSRNSNADGVWTHDKFQDSGFGGARAGGLRTGGTGPAKITISNLHFGVSDADILELFGELGRIKYASVHYDRTGRSMGKADVLFERRSEAQLAIQQYNGVPLDGRAMAITWASGAEVAATTSPRGGLRQIQGGRINRPAAVAVGRGRGGRGFRGARGGRGAAGAKRGGRGGGTPKTAAELDAELDAYIKQNPK